ncbi:MAG: hypothetical protein OEO79_07455 [Gemmatimonadota bacterium]|nr:hypothetical protein [Gemmatimonadota bacterium]MDH3421459.1 hypothetical protein [Gemmatimonadota bacterium]
MDTGKVIKRTLLGVAAAALLVAVCGGGYWALTCPCDGTPGFVLRGDVQEEPVRDWSFANEVDLCQVQISVGWRPHSVNLNCMATPSGDLFLSCSVGARKYWCPKVEADEPGRLRLDGNVYPVVLNRVADPATLNAAWAARIQKLQDPAVQARQPGGGGTPPPLDSERPDSWWTFQVRSAPAP